MDDLLHIIYEDGDLLVVNKPAGLVCHPTKTDAYSSLISRARLYLGGEASPQLINRLDRETSGVNLLAKNPESARKLRRLWEQRLVLKSYLAIGHGCVEDAHRVIDASLGKDDTSAVAIKDCARADGAGAKTEIWLEKTFTRSISPGNSHPAGNSGSTPAGTSASHTIAAPSETSTSPRSFSLLRVEPHTGRKHQIRIHLAHIGHPVVGDKLYGGDEDLYLALVENRLTLEQKSRLILPYHALHAAEVRFHWAGRELVFRAEPEPYFSAFCAEPPFPAVPFE